MNGSKSQFLRECGTMSEALIRLANVARFAAMAGGQAQGASFEELNGLETVLLTLEDGLRELSESAAPVLSEPPVPDTVPPRPGSFMVTLSADQAERLRSAARELTLTPEEAAEVCIEASLDSWHRLQRPEKGGGR